MPTTKIEDHIGQNGFNDCGECEHLQTWREWRPCGNGGAYERMQECVCCDDSECPLVDENK